VISTNASDRAPVRSDSTGRRPLVLISGKDTSTDVGGHESYVRAHALAAAAAGFAPHVFCLGTRSAIDITDGATIHRVAAPRLRRPPAALQQAMLARAVVRFLLERRGPHLIHGFAIWSGAGVIASSALGRQGVAAVPVASAYATRAYEIEAMQAGLGPYISRIRRVRYRTWQRWSRLVDDRVEGRAYRRSQLVVINYESVRKILVEAYGQGLEIRRLPYASAWAFAPDEPEVSVPPPPKPLAALRPPSAPLVIAVSRHDPRKGLDVLLRALALLTASGVAFRACLVGPGRLLATHRALAANLGLAEQVAIPGRVDDVRPYLRHADVFVLPSRAEASGSVSLLEALQSGTAVVASSCDGIPEDVADGVDALLVPPGDSRALASALASLLLDPGRRAQLASASRQAYEHRFSAARFVESLSCTYAELGFVP